MKVVKWAMAALIVAATPVAAKEILGVRISKEKASAAIIDAKGLPVGVAKFVETKNGLSIKIAVKGLQRGQRAVHIHTTGMCEGPKFASAGAHWNPENRAHGTDNPDGSHAGDLPNLDVRKNGRAVLSFDIPEARLNGPKGLLDNDGAAIVIHAQSDDNRSDPSGNSGDRIACGVIVKR